MWGHVHWSSVFTDSIFENLPTCKRLFVTLKSILRVLSSSFVDALRAMKNLGRQLRLNKTMLSLHSCFCSQTVNEYPFQVPHCLHFCAFLLMILLFQMAPSVVLKCWCLLKWSVSGVPKCKEAMMYLMKKMCVWIDRFWIAFLKGAAVNPRNS